MTRRIFFSFHYIPDNWRAAQVRNMGTPEGKRPVFDNDWEKVRRASVRAIESWIAGQISGRSCTVVLVGEHTAGRKWITYEIGETWSAGKGVVGIHIHNLLDRNGNQSQKGDNPFDYLTVGRKKLSSIVRLYNPPFRRSDHVYNYIEENIADWVEEAIHIRNSN